MWTFLKNNAVVLILMNLGNLFAYVFQIVISRELAPAEYGAFNALNSLVTIVAAPAVMLPFVFAHATADLVTKPGGLGQIHELMRRGLIAVTGITFAVLAISLVFLPWLQSYLHISQPLWLVLALILIATSMIFPVVLGILQGLGHYVHFSFGSSTVQIMRTFGALLLVSILGYGVGGALLSCILSTLCAFSYALWATAFLRKEKRLLLPEDLLPSIYRMGWPLLLSTISIMILCNIDVVLVRHFHPGPESGYYATAAVLGRIAFLLPSVLVNVLFPEIAKAKTAGADDMPMLLISLGLTALLGGAVALVFFLWPDFILHIFFGEQYAAGAATTLKYVSLAMVGLAVVQTYATYCVARGDNHFLWGMAIGVGFLLLGSTIYNDDIIDIAQLLLATVGIVLACCVLGHVFFQRKRIPV